MEIFKKWFAVSNNPTPRVIWDSTKLAISQLLVAVERLNFLGIIWAWNAGFWLVTMNTVANHKKLFEKNLKCVSRHPELRYYTQGKSCSNMIVFTQNNDSTHHAWLKITLTRRCYGQPLVHGALKALKCNATSPSRIQNGKECCSFPWPRKPNYKFIYDQFSLKQLVWISTIYDYRKPFISKRLF